MISFLLIESLTGQSCSSECTGSQVTICSDNVFHRANSGLLNAFSAVWQSCSSECTGSQVTICSDNVFHRANSGLLNAFSAVWDLLSDYSLWLRITDEGSVPEMRIWSISLIQSDLKWCIHLSRSLFFNFWTLKYLYLIKVMSCVKKIYNVIVVFRAWSTQWWIYVNIIIIA